MGLLFGSASGGMDMTTLNFMQGWSTTKRTAVLNVYEDLLSVTGKGYLKYIIVSNGTAFATGLFVKVTADGTVIFEGKTTTADTEIGIIQSSQTEQYTSGAVTKRVISVLNPVALSAANIGGFVVLPYTAAADAKIGIIDGQIWFNASLLIEIKNNINYDIRYLYEGAYV